MRLLKPSTASTSSTQSTRMPRRKRSGPAGIMPFCRILKFSHHNQGANHNQVLPGDARDLPGAGGAGGRGADAGDCERRRLLISANLRISNAGGCERRISESTRSGRLRLRKSSSSGASGPDLIVVQLLKRIQVNLDTPSARVCGLGRCPSRC